MPLGVLGHPAFLGFLLWTRAVALKLMPALLLFSMSREKFPHWDLCKELKLL